MSQHKNILILTYWSFKEGLIQTYTLPYVRLMLKHLPEDSKVYLFTMEKEELKLNPEEEKKQKQLFRDERIVWLPHNYFHFGGKGMIRWMFIMKKLWWRLMFGRFSHIHAWCTPPGMIGFILSRWTGKKLVLDSYEPHAEAMIENNTWTKEGRAFRLLFKYERKQTKRASHVISATEGMREYAKEKYNLEIENFFVKPACVNLELFSRSNLKKQNLVDELGYQDKIVCVYAGKFGGIYLEKEVFDFFKVAYDHWGDRFRVLLLTNHSEEEMREYCKQSDLDFSLITMKFVMHHEIPDYMGLADFAFTPVKSIPTKRYCTPIKDGEYWALGLPVVITRDISDDSDIIEKNDIGAVLHNLDEGAYLGAVSKIDQILAANTKEELYIKIRKIAEQYRSFEVADNIYKTIYGSGK